MAKILIVDDHENTQKLLQSVLGKWGHMCVCCNEPRDAIDKIQTEFFDLVITDVMMPGGITGFDFIKTLRSLPDNNSIPVIIVTGRREKRDIERGIQSGADDYVIKPIDPEILVSKVASLVSRKSKPKDGFAPGSVNMEATWDMPTEIVQATEVGIEIQSSLPVPVGQKVKLRSPFFQSVGIIPPVMRVVSCELRADINLYQIALHFVGLSEKELTPLRLWIRSSKVAKNAV